MEVEYAKIDVRGVFFDDVNMDEAVEVCKKLALDQHFHSLHTPNAEIVQLCVDKPEYYPIINSASLIIPDGAGVVLASKLLGRPLNKGKVAGVELYSRLCGLAAENGWGVYFLGGKPGVSQLAAENLKKSYPSLIISGIRDGYFKEDRPVIDEINRSGARILLVCLGVPRQEEWIYAHRDDFTSVRLAGGFGGSVDIYAGTAKRAPEFYIKHNLEWFYRLKCEPKRLGRMMKLPKFIFGTLICRFFRGGKG